MGRVLVVPIVAEKRAPYRRSLWLYSVFKDCGFESGEHLVVCSRHLVAGREIIQRIGGETRV